MILKAKEPECTKCLLSSLNDEGPEEMLHFYKEKGDRGHACRAMSSHDPTYLEEEDTGRKRPFVHTHTLLNVWSYKDGWFIPKVYTGHISHRG